MVLGGVGDKKMMSQSTVFFSKTFPATSIHVSGIINFEILFPQNAYCPIFFIP